MMTSSTISWPVSTGKPLLTWRAHAWLNHPKRTWIEDGWEGSGWAFCAEYSGRRLGLKRKVNSLMVLWKSLIWKQKAAEGYQYTETHAAGTAYRLPDGTKCLHIKRKKKFFLQNILAKKMKKFRSRYSDKFVRQKYSSEKFESYRLWSSRIAWKFCSRRIRTRQY